MLTRTQAEIMLKLQANMNARVDPRWLEARYPYLRAVVVEGAEAMDHHGWKWWKKQERDLEQLRMELVDIWHFTLSHILLEHGGDEAASADTLLEFCDGEERVRFDDKIHRINNMDTISKLELNTGLAAAGRISIPLFHSLLEDCGMEWNELFCQYVGKNVLNFFRQDHGYREGTYQKQWDGREDNQHLVEVMAELNSNDADFQNRLYASLKDRYLRS